MRTGKRSTQTDSPGPQQSSVSSPARFHQFFDYLREAVLLADPAGHVFAANPAACDLLRRSEQEICAAGRRGLVDTADPRFPAMNEQRTRIGQFVGEITMVRGDGTTFPGQVFTSAAFRDDGLAASTTMIVRDLTEHKAAEVELEEYRRRFEDLVRERAEEMREAGARVQQELAERERAEAGAQASERRFQTLVERSSDLVVIVDAEGRVSYCSPSVERLTGFRQDEVTGMIADELISGEDLAHIAALRKRPRKESSAGLETGTLRIRNRNGSPRWFEWSASRHLDDEAVRGIVVNARDVTERVLAERALGASEERYRTLAEASPDMIYVVGSDRCVQYVNDRAAKRFGVPAEKLIGMPLAGMFEGSPVVRTMAAVERVLASGEPYETDSIVAYPDGEAWVSTRLVALKDDGCVSAVLGVSRDITERRLAQDALAESERRYRSLFEDSPVAMWEEDHSAVKAHLEQLVTSGVEDVAGYLLAHPAEYARCVTLARTLDANRAAVALFEAASREELVERQDDLYPSGSVGGLPVFWAAMLAGERSACFEETNLTLAGREVHLLETCSAAPGHEDSFDRVYIADVDVSERRRAESELAQATARLKLTLETTVATLGAAAELRDPYTAGHQRRVAELACAIAAELCWSEERIEPLRTAALLHDIGKIVVPAEILSKPGKLSENEMLIIRQHAGAGAEVLADIDFGSDIGGMVRQHHERLDGSGYPDGLTGDDILPEARILAVADVVEAMASHRPYRPALPLDAALEEIAGGSGGRYDADASEAAIRLFREQGFTFSE